jgi:hypothetical protein
MQSNVSDPAPEAAWQVWYQDTFDRECPRSVEISGQGLVRGLAELWTRHLRETVLAGGQRGFSRFNLWWKQEGRSIAITGEWEGQIRLRGWVSGKERATRGGHKQAGDETLLMKVALAHARLVMVGQSSEPILAAVKAAASRRDFEAQLEQGSWTI